VLVVQKELGSDDRRKLWGSPIRVYAAPPGTPRPDPARPPEAQGWQELTEGGGMLRRPRAPGTGAWFQEQLARLMAEGNPWVVGHWRRLADREGAAKDAEVDRIEAEQSQMVRVALMKGHSSAGLGIAMYRSLPSARARARTGSWGHRGWPDHPGRPPLRERGQPGSSEWSTGEIGNPSLGAREAGHRSRSRRAHTRSRTACLTRPTSSS
jgi:hypothetical protein